MLVVVIFCLARLFLKKLPQKILLRARTKFSFSIEICILMCIELAGSPLGRTSTHAHPEDQ